MKVDHALSGSGYHLGGHNVIAARKKCTGGLVAQGR